LRYLQENGCDETVVKHCLAVSELAVKIAKRCRADVHLVEIGGLLHDLGRCKSHTLTHAVEGAKIARSLNMPSALVKIIERHIGAGILPDEAVRLGLPRTDYSPKTLEEKIVAHADNLISGAKRTTVKEAAAYLVRTGQPEVAQRVLALHKGLSSSCGIDIDLIF
jgi:uncharacterized protein (TIGR00295 family)